MTIRIANNYATGIHMCLVGPLNPYILEQSWELTFLIDLTLLNTKLASKNLLKRLNLYKQETKIILFKLGQINRLGLS